MDQAGLTPTKQCSRCKKTKPVTDYYKSVPGTCKVCWRKEQKPRNDKSNPLSMYVNGKYVSRKHPLYKPGRYTSLGGAWSFAEMDKRHPSGFVYLIGNKAWPGWIKCGMAVNIQDRLNSYQTSSPHRDYFVLAHWSAECRRSAERRAHDALAKVATDRKGEWFCVGVDASHELAKTWSKENP